MAEDSARNPGRPNNWGRWGADDERGALNLLRPHMMLQTRQSITTGDVYSLGIPIQAQDVPLYEYRGTPMRLTLQDSTDDGMFPPELGCHEGTGAHEDVLVMASHTTSHMDALIHVYGERSHYNGVAPGAMRALSGASRLGIEKVGGIAARGVLLDMVRYFDDAEHWVEPGRNITGADLEAAANQQATEVRAGDVVLVRTGYLRFWQDHRDEFSQPGIGTDAARWLAAHDVVAVGSDNGAVEVIPFDDNDFLAVHKVLLVDHGIYLLEFLNLEEPAADGNYEGLLTVAPLKVTGATGSPVNPIFIT